MSSAGFSPIVSLKILLKEKGIADEDMINNMAMVAILQETALQGNAHAFVVFRDTMGENPADDKQTEVFRLRRPRFRLNFLVFRLLIVL